MEPKRTNSGQKIRCKSDRLGWLPISKQAHKSLRQTLGKGETVDRKKYAYIPEGNVMMIP